MVRVTATPQSADAAVMAERLAAIVGSEHVLSDPSSLDYFSRDFSFLPYQKADLVVRPGTLEQLSDAVVAAAGEGYAIFPRGGGMSYTRAFTPDRPRSIVVDLRRMDRVLDVDAENMYVTVECGCTWKKLYETLAEYGLRTPYYGPLSGFYATVGGALSQNSLFLGSGDNHTAAESLLGLDVVLADGSLLTTGSAARRDGKPFYRHFGPDITGIFTADCGALGIKARATFRLLRRPAATRTLSFAFANSTSMVAVESEMARLGIAAECYGFCPEFNASFEKRGISFQAATSTLRGLFRGRSLWQGVRQSLRLGLAGRKSLRGVRYSLHITLEGVTAAIAEEKLTLARSLCLQHGGVELQASLPTAFNAAPFDSISTFMTGADGQVWVPIHGFFPLSRASAAVAAVEMFLRQNRQRMDAHRITATCLTCYSGAEFVVEPSFYWYDALEPARLDKIDRNVQERLAGRAEDVAAREVALALRDELRDVLDELGACHLQLGRYYDFQGAISNPPLKTLLGDLKKTLDPERIINPGALGL